MRRPKRLRFVALGICTVMLWALCAEGLSLSAQPAAGPGSAAGTAPLVLELRIEDAIHGITQEHLEQAFDSADGERARLILLTLKTPGGLDSAMRAMIERIIRAKTPVAIYVSPSGSRAASAGFFLLMSCDIAAMAPGTNTGAASPVFVSPFSGTPIDVGETMRKKVIEDASAYLRTLVEKRGRNVELAAKAVTEAKSFTEKEALDGKLIDLVAPSVEELLKALDGREVKRFDGSKQTLDLKGATRRSVEMTGRQRFLARLLHPDVFFVMLLLGVLGLYVEFSHPGLIVPGVVGGISLVLALYAMQILPVNFAGLMLIALALALFILEAKFTSHGVLGLGGAVAMVLGALMLIRSPMTGWGVSLGMALAVTVPTALICIYLMRIVLRSMSWKAAVGSEALAGTIGEVREALLAAGPGGRGSVFVSGELWRAEAREAIPAGARVKVVRVEGLTLHVEAIAEEQPPAAN